MRMFKFANKMLCLALTIILLLIIISFALFTTHAYDSVFIEVNKTELNNVEKIVEALPSISPESGGVRTVSSSNAEKSTPKTINATLR